MKHFGVVGLCWGEELGNSLLLGFEFGYVFHQGQLVFNLRITFHSLLETNFNTATIHALECHEDEFTRKLSPCCSKISIGKLNFGVQVGFYCYLKLIGPNKSLIIVHLWGVTVGKWHKDIHIGSLWITVVQVYHTKIKRRVNLISLNSEHHWTVF